MARVSAPANGEKCYKMRRVLPRLMWTAAAVVTAVTADLVIGNITLNTQSAYASELLRTAASDATSSPAWAILLGKSWALSSVLYLSGSRKRIPTRARAYSVVVVRYRRVAFPDLGTQGVEI